MRISLHLLLLLCLTLTSIGLGAARGTVQIAGQVVICTGEGVVIQSIPGTPAQKTAHICPDMALSLLNNVMIDSDMPLPQYRVSRLADDRAAVLLLSKDSPKATARDPPESLFSA